MDGERWDSRTEALLGAEALARLSAARVAVFGVGGVGGHAAEALARCGVGALELVDDDVVSPSNLNRQVLALRSTLGRPKVDVAAERIRDINPGCAVSARRELFLPSTADSFDFSSYDYVLDCIDTVAGKIEIVMRALAAGVPVVSAMGAGNKLDPGRFRVCDIYSTDVCPLARVMRRELRRRGVGRLAVVFSDEPPVLSSRVPASVPFVPGAAGLLMAGKAVRDLAGIGGE